jgi:mono/diheme cytochrome c family protein
MSKRVLATVAMATTVTLVAAAVMTGCSKSEGNASSDQSGGNGKGSAAATPGVVHKIEIPKYQTDFPDATGREQFATACLSCHTTMYISMQPPLTAAKWEEEVRKMQKTYGAPIAEEQVKPIVQYLMTVKEGSGPRLRQSLAATPPNNPPVLVSRDPADRADDASRGEAVFATLCASCHGPDGHGNGPAGLVLLPHPADLTAGRMSAKGIAHVVANGMPGTGMPAFGTAPQKDVRAVESYVLTLCTDDAPPTAVTEEAKQLYVQNCANCHGEDGRGDGIAGKLLPRPAADFHLRRPTLDHATEVITEGVPGTGMPAWKTKLSDQQRATLANYVRTFFEEK